MLKSALDGSVYAPPENVLIYVTSNRRHLVPEYESDNRGAMMAAARSTTGGRRGEDLPLGTVRHLGRFPPVLAGPVRRGGPALGGEDVRETRCTPPVDEGGAGRVDPLVQRKGDRSGRIAYQFAAHWVGKELLRGEPVA